MGKTSTDVKKRYNQKTYSRYACDIRNEEFEEIEKARAKSGLSRTEFLKMLFNFYQEHQE